MKKFYLSAMRLTLAFLVFFLSLQTNSQTLTARPGVVMTTNCNGFYQYTPAGYNPTGTTRYPVIISYGGLSENGDGSATQLPKVLNYFGGPGWQIKNGKFPSSITVNGQVFRFIVIFPQFSAIATPAQLNDVVSYVIRNFKVDSTRIYMTGLSLGGGYCWDYPGANVAYGKRLAAIVPVAGGTKFYTTTKAQNIAAANLPVWATHNENDPSVPSSLTKSFVNGINSMPVPPNPRAKMTIFAGTTHNCSDATYNMTTGIGAYAWMLQYTRTTAANRGPVAKAGNDITITLPTKSAQLNGSASSDPDGTIVSYSWAKMAGPTQFTFNNSKIVNPVFGNLVAGTYTIRLTVTDNRGAISTDDVVVKVNPAVITQSGFKGTRQVTTEVVGDNNGVYTKAPSLTLASSVNVFPNPATNSIRMQVNNQATGTMTVQVMNANGTIVRNLSMRHTSPVSNVSIATDDLPSGVYVIKVQIGSWTANRKLVK